MFAIPQAQGIPNAKESLQPNEFCEVKGNNSKIFNTIKLNGQFLQRQAKLELLSKIYFLKFLKFVFCWISYFQLKKKIRRKKIMISLKFPYLSNAHYENKSFISLVY